MNFNKHFYLEGKHAFLSASQYHWIRYSDEQLDNKYFKASAARRGTELHELASRMIRLGIRAEDNPRNAMYQYVNDAIGFRMTAEQVLFFSDNVFGTADAISFYDNHLRIFDLKTGENEAKFDQLLVYAAMFCLEYNVMPFEITYDLRIYQGSEIRQIRYDPEHDELSPADVAFIMDKIRTFDRRINELKAEEEGL